MGDRAKRRRRRFFFSYLLLAVISFAVFRSLGPVIITVRGTSLSPVLEDGDIVLARRGTRDLERGSVVLARAPLRTGSRAGELFHRLRYRFSDSPPPGPVGRPVPRVVAGLPGDLIQWDHRGVLVGSDRYEVILLHQDLPGPEETVLLGDDEFFLLALQPGRADSRIVGPLDRSRILFRIQSIILPVDRRGIVESVLPESSGVR
ncbi:MAG: hypothetical protein EA427_16845 [Spirochaetaceae bacterium]|nr:MAG: hypothetical protein EA427_16845 [Spirochaetaceae bacterium]